ncbi:MAG TPA: AAA family ATPase [Gammaproteobacteria bacterium]|nr:AAA family ATPase [Gammaproteobacteria bacterium]
MSTTPDLIILRGLPGSGKTTFAKKWVAESRAYGARARVNRDDIRQMVFGQDGVFEPTREELVTVVQNETIKQFLRKGTSVIVDNINLRVKYIRELYEIGLSEGANPSILEFKTPVDVCVSRDRNRDRRVGADVIRDMAKKFTKPGLNGGIEFIDQFSTSDIMTVDKVDLTYDINKRDVYLIDIDGTIALHKTRSPYDYTKVSEDEPNPDVISLIIELCFAREYQGVMPVFLSGRPDSCRDDTFAWLEKQFLGPISESGIQVWDGPYMRKTGDTRPDWIVKRELFMEHIYSRYNVRGVFDDRNQVVRMWRGLGLTCFQVAEGNF